MNWLDQIINYQPDNSQEAKDKETFLYSIRHFDNVLTRDNPIIHITSSAFIVNKTFDRALMVYHNIYQSWSWTGGHVDGEVDFLNVAIKEAKEETGIQIHPISNEVLSLDVLTVLGHIKRGIQVSPHLHLSIAYGATADTGQVLKVKEDENSAVKWIPLDQINDYSSEEHMKNVYDKIINKILNSKRY